ncbi:MAG: ExbD/TolR family protein [Flavobacteriaceae bacterium]
MRVDYAIRRSRRLALTPLIDVIFLLLLFFMLSSTFTRFAQIELAAGTSGTSSAQQRPDIFVRLDDRGISVNGRAVADETLPATLAELEGAGARTAVVLVRGEVDSQRLVSLIEQMRRAGGLEVTIAK